MSFYKYSVCVLGAIVISEISFVFLRKIFWSISKVCRIPTSDVTKNFSQVLFFPDQGIIRQDYKDEKFRSVNNSPHTSILTAGPKNERTKQSKKDFDHCIVKPNTFLHPCTKSSLTNGNLKRSSSLIHMIDILDSAKTSLMLCLYILSSKDLINAILRAKTRGVHVRVLLASEMCSESCEEAMNILQCNNVFVRPSRSPLMMHHKFALVDTCADCHDTAQPLKRDRDKTLMQFMATRNTSSKPEACAKVSEGKGTKSHGILMTGSFNWTWSAVVKNHENVLITSHPILIQHFTQEFESLWQHNQHQENRQGYQDINCGENAAVYYQAVFFPDQGITNNGSSMADFGTANNSPMPTKLQCPRVKVDMKNFYPHKTNDLPFYPQQSRTLTVINEPDVSLQYSSTLRHSTSLIHMIRVLDSAQESLIVCLHTLTCRDLIDAIVRAQSRGVLVRVLGDAAMWSETCQQTMDTFHRHNVPFQLSHPALVLHHKFAVVDIPSVSTSWRSNQTHEAQKTVDKSVVLWCILNILKFGNVFQSHLRLNGVLESIICRQLSDIWNSFRGHQFIAQICKSQKDQGKLTGVLMTGSFNWTRSAVVCNHENVVITNDPVLVQNYAQEFESLWSSCPGI